MKAQILNRLNHKYPQNFILKNPLSGSLIFLIVSFIFTVLYRPLKMHESLNFSYSATMGIYILSWAISIYLLIRLVKAVPFFSAKNEWTLSKDIISILIVLAATGITSYIMGFVMENPSDRWNVHTFLDSCKYALFIGIIPFGFFTLINYRHLFYEEVSLEFDSQLEDNVTTAKDKIRIISKLKKEELSFFPHQFLYAESDGNYVKFYLEDKERIRTELIRNSITEVERQLSGISYFKRVHRAFIVNMKMIRSKKGNTLGYRIKLYGTEAEIPVSRQKVREFDSLLKQYR